MTSFNNVHFDLQPVKGVKIKKSNEPIISLLDKDEVIYASDMKLDITINVINKHEQPSFDHTTPNTLNL